MPANLKTNGETKYHLLFEHMVSGFAYHRIIADSNDTPVDYEFLIVNKAFEKLTGLKSEDIIGKRVTEVLPDIKNDDFDWIATYGKVALTGEPLEFEQYSKTLQRWYKISAYCPQKNHFAVTFADITNSKQTEERLRASRAKLNLALDAADAGIWEWNTKTDEHTWTDKLWSLFGLESGTDKPSFDLWLASVHPDDRNSAAAKFETLSNSDNELEFEWRVNLPNDEVRWLMFRGQLERDDTGQVIRCRGVVIDITARKKAEKNLYFMKFAVDNSNDGAFWSRKSGHFVYINDAACRRLGYTRDELLTMTVFDIDPNFPPEEWEAHWEDLKQKGSVSIETLHERKDGSLFPVEITANFVRYGGEEYNCSFVRNITKRKETEKKLSRSEARFRLLYENAPMPYQSLDYNGYFLEVNQAWLEMLGYSKEEVIGKSFGDFLLPEMKEHFKYNFPRFKEKGEILGVEFEMVKKDGSIMMVRFNGRIGYDEKGHFKQTHCVFQDVTAARKAEYERQLNEDRLESLLMLHEERTLPERKFLENALEEAVRLTESECGYLHFVDDDKKSISLNIWSKDTLKICKASQENHYPLANAGIWADCVRQRKPVIHNDYQKNPDKKGYPEGHFPVIRHMSVPVFDGKSIVAIIGVGNKQEPYNEADQRQLQLYFSSTWDIIKRKRIEEEQKIMRAQLQQAQKMEAIGTLAGGIAHDFNNLLSTIMGYAEMSLDDAPAGSPLHKDLNAILISATRARDLVKQILAFSRQATVERIPLKIQPLIKEGLKMLRSSLPTTISITEEIDPKCGAILADPTQIYQILMNLGTNAYHAMEEKGGVLAVTLKTVSILPDNGAFSSLAGGDYIELTVSDTGYGIGPDVMNKIFDPFFTTKETGKGTGMGLAIIHGIISDYGGTITVESQLGKGTTFHVYLPTLDKEPLPEQYKAEEIPLGSEHILFIDDEDLLAQMGKVILERLGYQVTVCCNSFAALETFEKNPDAFDLVITDQTMPGLTGADLSRRMLQIRPDVPIILCTGYSNLIDESSSKSLGIKEFAFKPLTKEVIAQLIRKVLDVDGRDR